MTLVPDDFVVPDELVTPAFVLRPLDVEHNSRDFDAWQSSIDHIRATPGFTGRSWPDPEMTLDDNAEDLAMHARHFADREGFTYTVLDPVSADVIGCVYLYPASDDNHDVEARCWVRASHAALDGVLRRELRRWLADEWPFERVLLAG